MRIAIIGTRISGLTCAHLLHRQHELTLFEAGETFKALVNMLLSVTLCVVAAAAGIVIGRQL